MLAQPGIAVDSHTRAVLVSVTVPPGGGSFGVIGAGALVDCLLVVTSLLIGVATTCRARRTHSAMGRPVLRDSVRAEFWIICSVVSIVLSWCWGSGSDCSARSAAASAAKSVSWAAISAAL